MSNTSYSEIEKYLPSIVKAELSKTDDFHRKLFAEEFGKKRKNLFLCYLFWFIFYTHRWHISGKLGITLLQWLSIMFLIGFVWVIIDLFLIPKMCRERNEEIAKDVLVEHKAMQSKG